MSLSPILVVRDLYCSPNGSIRWCAPNLNAPNRRRIEQCPQRPKRSDIHMRKRLDSHRRACRSIEHPQRQFQPTTGRALIMATAGHGARHLVDHLMNLNGASCPRMPKIENFAALGPMGVASSRCTMASVPIRALTALRRTRLTSPSCPSAWQPNPGRGSTYRRGNSVQRIGTTAYRPVQNSGTTSAGMLATEYHLKRYSCDGKCRSAKLA